MKVALLQLTPGVNPDENFEIAQKAIQEASENNADLVLLPELWTIGYTSPEDYAGGKPAWHDAALRISDAGFKRYQELASGHVIAIAFPYLEKDDEERYFNSIALIDRRGEVVLGYRKAHLVHLNWEKDTLSAGNVFPVAGLDTNSGIVKIGSMICYDREFPEAARILMLHGAEIVLVPNACYLDTNRLDQFRGRGFENMTGMAMTNYPAGRGSFNGRSVAYDGMREKGVDYDSTLVIADDKEGIWYANFDMDRLRAYRLVEQWGSKFRRPELYKDIARE